MDKADHFLWIVQTMVLANAVNLASQPMRAKVFRDEISASGVFIAMDEAVRASQLIPAHMPRRKPPTNSAPTCCGT